MMDKQNGWIFLIEDDYYKQHNTVWDKVSADIEKSFIARLSLIKDF